MSTLIRRISQRIDYISETRSPVNTDGARPHSGVLERDINELADVLHTLNISFSDVDAIVDAFKNANGVGINDRKLLLEKAIVIMSGLKALPISLKLQQFVLNLLYKDLPHPPSSYLAVLPLDTKFQPIPQGRVKYVYRTADGSYNNPLIPSLGKAGTPYARSVASSNISPKGALPDPGLVFDTLLKRDKFEKHPGGISALFFAFADLVIHSIFNTNHSDWTINDASSYLDLSILYGSNEDQINSVRRKDGSGKLLDDVFADKRLLMMPPSSCALLILLNRNHNYIAQRLLEINENGNFEVNPTDETKKRLQDDELFHRSRLVNCGYFMQIILGDYVGAILGLVRDGSDWRLNPLMTMREITHDFAPTGEGNVVSIEFNLLYRWHATLSQPDTEWISKFFGMAFQGKDVTTISIDEFKQAAASRLASTTPPTEWQFGGLKRDKDTNRFSDAGLADLLHNATEARAGAFKARGIPECLRVIEMMGIQQSRSWGACSLNEFRKFLGLKPYETFKEWNPDPEIHTAAAALYRDIDNLELHVGLQAEEAKSPGPGAGLCPGYTISRAILADAVCLTRGDRFLTTEFTPYNLSAWGYQDCQFDPKDGSYGGLLTKLFFRTLPDYFPKGSAYAHFPFLDPKYMEDYMMRKNPTQAVKYTWTRPKPLAPTLPVDDFSSVNKVLIDSSSYLSAYDGRLFTTVEPAMAKADSVKLSSSKSEKRRNRLSLSFSTSDKELIKAAKEEKNPKEDERKAQEEERLAAAIEATKAKLITGTSSLNKLIFTKPQHDVATYFKSKTSELIKAKSFAKVGGAQKCVDIVKDVINLLPVHWISHILGLPLKSESSPNGAWYESELYEKFANVSRYVYLNFDSVDDWKLREESQAEATEVIEFVKIHVEGINSLFSLSDSQNHLGITDGYSHEFLKKLWQANGKKGSYREFASQLFAAVVPTSALYSQSLAHVVNFYLDEDKKTARDEIVRLVNSEEKDAAAKVLGYVYEALRLDPPLPGVYRTAAKDDILDGVDVKTGTHVFASIANANRDVSSFGPNAAAADFLRASTKPGIGSFGAAGLLTSEFFDLTLPTALGAILGLEGLERGPGKSGVFVRFSENLYGTNATQYFNLQGLVTPFADSLIVQYTK